MTPAKLIIIAAVTSDGGIGRDADLLFRISADMKRFKALTMGHPIIMGRKTFESFPNGPLPGRRNIVITRQADYAPHPDVVVAESPEAALKAIGDSHTAFIIGGGEIYRRFMPLATELDITRIHSASPEGTNVWFPVINAEQWTLTAETSPETDSRNSVEYTFQTFQRNILK